MSVVSEALRASSMWPDNSRARIRQLDIAGLVNGTDLQVGVLDQGAERGRDVAQRLPHGCEASLPAKDGGLELGAHDAQAQRGITHGRVGLRGPQHRTRRQGVPGKTACPREGQGQSRVPPQVRLGHPFHPADKLGCLAAPELRPGDGPQQLRNPRSVARAKAGLDGTVRVAPIPVPV